MDRSLPGSSVHGDSPGKNTGVGCHVLPQRIFRIRDRTCISYVSVLAGRFFTISANWEAPHLGHFVKVEFEHFQGGQVLSSLPKATPFPKVLLLLHAFGWMVWLLRIPAGGVSDFPSLKGPLDPDC